MRNRAAVVSYGAEGGGPPGRRRRWEAGASRVAAFGVAVAAVAALLALAWAAAPARAAGSCPNAAIREAQGATHVPDCRAYELVTPADKPGGQGIGSYGSGGDSDNTPGLPSIDGDRVVSQSLAGNLTPGSFLYGQDWAFSERAGDAVGWVSHSPFTHKEYNTNGGSNVFFSMLAASRGLETMVMGGGVNSAHIFPEMAGWDQSISAAYVTDWNARWELVAPTSDAVGDLESPPNVHVSADGSHVALLTQTRGQLGASDPSGDQVANSYALYVDDLSAGLSDRFTPNGVRRLVGVCTGGGADRTLIPSVDGAGKLGAQTCPDPAPGRDAAPISGGGASIGLSATYTVATSTTNALSDDGSRLFFHSPSPYGAGSVATCSGTGAGTQCPAQLYVNQTGADGQPTVRWISRSAVADQDASLTGPALYEGASTTGSAVFFRTDTPLTADDRNGGAAAPVTTGTPSTSSWDLYRYDVPSNASGHPGGADPGDGTLTRISAGPLGTGDCQVSTTTGSRAALRFASDDGTRAYFICAAPLPGVATNDAPSDGTSTHAGLAGTLTNPSAVNLYLYDASKALADRWEFIAQLPTSGPYAGCATNDAELNQPIEWSGNGSNMSDAKANCFRGTADGSFVTFMTPGQLIAGDPDATSVDIYAFDAEADRLIRLSAPQGGAGGTYGCAGSVNNPTGFCFADAGVANKDGSSQLGVATTPATPGDRIAFFESKSRLVPEDVNDAYDVYEWRDGDLRLLSAGVVGKGSYYSGNSADGRDVFIETRDQLSWQDGDGVMDIYDARIDGGIPQPAAGPPACDVLGGTCQGPTPGTTLHGTLGSVAFTGPGNESTPPGTASARFSVGRITPAKRRRMARTGRLTLRAKVSQPGRIVVNGRARLPRHKRASRVLHAARTAKRAGVLRIAVRLSRPARRALARGHRLTVRMAVSYSKVRGARKAVVRLAPARGHQAKQAARRHAHVAHGRAHAARHRALRHAPLAHTRSAITNRRASR